MLGAVPELSVAVSEADWLAGRLSSPASAVVTSVVPSGFEAYARVLHPIEEDAWSGAVRWAQVAAWSGVKLERETQFADIAFPAQEPADPAPWSGQAPWEGQLDTAGLTALSEALAEGTSTPEDGWMCVWDGYAPSSAGPRVRLPWREYLLYAGPVRAVPCFEAGLQVHPPNLWWPADRAWCAASEIDLPWTYVAGSSALIGRLLREPGIEAQPVRPTDNFRLRAPLWLRTPIEHAAAELLDRGQATLRTWKGNIQMQLERPTDSGDGSLVIQTKDPHTATSLASAWERVSTREPERLRELALSSLTHALTELAKK